MTTSLSTTTPPKPRKGSRGGDSIASLGAGEEVELKEAGPSRARVGDDQQATSPRREKAAVDNDGVEELDIDGTVVDKTIRKKKSKRRSAKKDDDGEVVRLQDLSGKSSRGTMRRAYDPGGDEKGNMVSLSNHACTGSPARLLHPEPLLGQRVIVRRSRLIHRNEHPV